MPPDSNPFLLDVDSLNLGEFGLIEEFTGLSFPEIIAGFAVLAATSPKFLIALTAIAGARADSEFTVNDAANILLVDLQLDDGG